MNNIEILPLSVDLLETFSRSSRDALDRARAATSSQAAVAEPTGLNIFSHRRNETQASVESVVFSFLAIEATINYLFFHERQSPRATGLDRWLRQNWRRLSVHDRLVLLVGQYSTATLDDFPYLANLFSEFVGFRNRIVHAHPEQYHALVEPGLTPGEVLIHDVELVGAAKGSPASGLSKEIGRIGINDASRGFEIMLLVLSFLDEQFVAELELPWPCKQTTFPEEHLRPRHILVSLSPRHYPQIDPESFVPEFIAKLRKSDLPNQDDDARLSAHGTGDDTT